MDSIMQHFSKNERLRIIAVTLILAAVSLLSNHTDAQYFGRNKPGYRKFNFDVVQTPHFEIYHYLRNDSMIHDLAQWSENWYKAHLKIFRDTFKVRNPILFYNNVPDFQQTNAVSSLIGNGTGGVTEELKDRVILPIAMSLAQTDHVLGHELVHAFQYRLFMNRNGMPNFSMNNIPLWMIEGMAEYLSIGSVDPHTSMWIRDALLNNDFPTLRQVETDPKYFPYRFGEAFWAMAGKTWGDTIFVPLLKRAAMQGFDKAAESYLKYNEKTLSGMWRSASEVYYSKYLKSKSDSLAGRKIVTDKNAGELNISPSISPDGKYIAFFSEKNIFTLDLYLADASTGKIIRKLSSVVKNNEIDDFDFIESAGTWSPDSKQFAFAIFDKGVNKLAIINIGKSKFAKEIEIPGIRSFSNPSWSPDGKKIVFTGLVDGVSDLYLYDLKTGAIDRLTDDFTANILPSWSSDGNSIVYSQERVNGESNRRKFGFDLAILDLRTKKITRINVFKDAYNMNPWFSADDKSIYFLSDADGFRNLYRYDLESQSVYRLTNYMTGITGITEFSPALSVAKGENLIVYNYYFDYKYQILAAKADEFKPVRVDGNYVNFDAGTLPPLPAVAKNIVDSTLYNREEVTIIPKNKIQPEPYKSKFRLDYISNNATIGVSTGVYRNYNGGSINAIFSDMVGNNQLYTSLSLNGEIYDFGGIAAYINQKGKIKWGAAISHIPYLFASGFIRSDSLTIQDTKIPVDNLAIDYLRMFEDNISLFAALPFSQTRRLEASLSSSWYYYRIDQFNNYYTLDGTYIGANREKLPAPKGDNFQQGSLAYVEDNSFFGMTSPMQGHRERFEVDKYFGSANIYTALIDYRRYFYIKPFSLAFRLYNFGMYGKDAESGVIPPFYLGYPWLVRGYENVGYGSNSYANSFDIAWLSGTKMLVGNAELRLPLTGPQRLAMIKSKWFLTDLNLFFDSGLAWQKGNNIKFENPSPTVGENDRFPVYSAGVSLRVNVFGYLVLEPYYAFPFQYGGFKNGQFGLNFIPGW